MCACRSPEIRINLKDRLPKQTASMCIYSFTCSCGLGYDGRATRHLAKRIREHHPRWLEHGETRTANSAIVNHLVESGHRVNTEQAFRVIYRTPPNLPKFVRFNILCAAEAMAIRQLDPELCNHKRLLHALGLPWPPLNHNRDRQARMSSQYAVT